MKAKEAEDIKSTYEQRGCRAVVNIYGKRTQNVAVEHDGWNMVINRRFASGTEPIMSDKTFFSGIILPDGPPKKSRSEVWTWSSREEENGIRVNDTDSPWARAVEIDIYGHFFASGIPYFSVRFDCAKWYKTVPLQFESLESAIQEIRRMDERIKSEYGLAPEITKPEICTAGGEA